MLSRESEYRARLDLNEISHDKPAPRCRHNCVPKGRRHSLDWICPTPGSVVLNDEIQNFHNIGITCGYGRGKGFGVRGFPGCSVANEPSRKIERIEKPSRPSAGAGSVVLQ